MSTSLFSHWETFVLGGSNVALAIHTQKNVPVFKDF